MAALELRGLRKNFRNQPVLEGIDLDIPAGSLVAVLGASGSGKTTLLRLIAGFDRPDAGTIAIGGARVAAPGLHLPPERRGVGMVMQEGALFPHLSVAENIRFGVKDGTGRQRGDIGRDGQVAALLALVGLPAGIADRAPHRLSGGEQQRVALARALAPRPKLILLDEPFSALDAALRVETRQAVAAALRAVGASAILVTHDQGEALSMGEQVAVLRRGRLVQVAKPAELYRQPADAELARFIGDAVLLAGLATAGAARCGLGTLPIAHTPARPAPADGRRIEVMLRPEQIRLVADGAGADGAGADGAGAPALVEAVTFYGHDAVVDLRLAADGARICARLFSFDLPVPGQMVGLVVDGPVVVYPAAIPVCGPAVGD